MTFLYLFKLLFVIALLPSIHVSNSALGEQTPPGTLISCELSFGTSNSSCKNQNQALSRQFIHSHSPRSCYLYFSLALAAIAFTCCWFFPRYCWFTVPYFVLFGKLLIKWPQESPQDRLPPSTNCRTCPYTPKYHQRRDPKFSHFRKNSQIWKSLINFW